MRSSRFYRPQKLFLQQISELQGKNGEMLARNSVAKKGEKLAILLIIC